MLTKFEIKNARGNGKNYSLELTDAFTISPMGRLKGKSTVGEGIISGVSAFSMLDKVSDVSRSLSDDEINDLDAVLFNYHGIYDGSKFEYSIGLVGRSIVKSESLVVDGRIVFEKKSDSLSEFYLDLKGAETLNTNLGNNRTIRLLNYISNNSLYDPLTDKGKVLNYLFCYIKNAILFSSVSCFTKDSSKTTVKFIKDMIDPRNKKVISNQDVNNRLNDIFDKIELKEYLRFSVKFRDDFDGRTIAIEHDAEEFIIGDSSPYLFLVLLKNALLSLTMDFPVLVYQDDAFKELAIVAKKLNLLIDFYPKGSQLILS